MIRKQKQVLSYILMFALLFNLLLPYPLVKAEANSLITIKTVDEKEEYSSGDNITFKINYNLETLGGTPGEETDNTGEPGETGETEEEPDQSGNSGETGESGAPGGEEPRETGESVTRETDQLGETGETSEPVTGEESVAGEPGEVSGETGDESGQIGETEDSEVAVEEETGNDVPVGESGDNGQAKIAGLVTIEVQLPEGIEYDDSIHSEFRYDAGNRTLTATLQEGESGKLEFSAKLAEETIEDVVVSAVLKVDGFEEGSAHVTIKVAKVEETPVKPEEGVVLKGTVTKDNPLSGEKFSYVIDYSLSALTSSFMNGELVVQLPDELVFDPQDVQLTIHFTKFEYDKDKHQIVLKLKDDQPAGIVGQLRINNLQFPNYVTPNGTEAVIKSEFTSKEISGAAEDVTVTAQAKAQWELKKKKITPHPDPMPNTDVVYEIVFRNTKGTGNDNGSLKLDDVKIIDQLPKGAVYVSSSPKGVYDNNTVSWTPNLAADSNYNRFTVTVRYPDAEADAEVINKAFAEFTPLGEEKLTLKDEAKHGFTLKPGDWGAWIYKSINGAQQEISPGQEVTFYVGGIVNASNGTMENTKLIDMTPEGLELKSIYTPTFTGIKEYKIFTTTSENPDEKDWNLLDTVSATENKWFHVDSSSPKLPMSVKGIRVDLGNIPTTFEMTGAFTIVYQLDPNYEIKSEDENEPFDTITNTALLTYTFNGKEQKPQKDSANVYVADKRPLLEVAKWANDHTFKTGDTVEYTIRVDNHELSSDIFINPVVEDLLPVGLEYVEGTWKLDGNVKGLQNPKFKAIENYNESGRTMLRWYWDQFESIPINKYFSLKFDAKINEKALKGESHGTIENRVEVSSKSGGYINDANFKNQRQYKDGRWYIFADNKIAVNSDANLESVKWVKGELDEEWSKYPEVATTTPGGQVEYKLAVKNTGTIPMKEVTIVDVLPRVGDTGVIVGAPRGSQWSPVLSAAVSVPDGVKVFYSSTDNDVKMNPITGAVSGTWEEQPPHDLTTVQALKFVFESVLNPGEEFELVWPMRAPVGAPAEGEVAWNSFGFTAKRADNDQALLPAEPIKVGVKIKPSEKAELGDYVWFDENGDGIQNEPKENGVNGVKVDLLDKDGKQLIASTITSDDMDGNPGYYLFPNLEPGKYIVKFHLPEGYKGFTKYQKGDDPAKDSDAQEDGTTEVIELAAGEKNHTIDAGLVKEQKPEVHKPGINKTVNGKEAVKLGTKTELFTYHVNVTIPADTTGYESLEITDQLEEVLEVVQTKVFTGEQDLSSDGTLTTENNKVSFKFKEDFDYEAIAGKVVTLEIKAKIKANADLSHYADHKVPNKATLIFNAEPTVSNTVVVEVEPGRPVNPGEPGDPEGPGPGPGPGPNPGPGPKEPTNPTDPTKPKETPTDPEDLTVIDDEDVPIGGTDPENPDVDLTEINDKVPTGVPTDKPGEQLPKTGEESMLLLQLAGLGLILIGLMGIFYRRKRT